jgi:hypothetical protein
MTIVDRSIVLEAPATAVWAAVKTPAAFRAVTRGLISVPVIASRDHPLEEGETIVGWVLLFGFVPFSRHHLHIARIDEAAMTLTSHEHGGILRRWNHDIVVTPAGADRCVYRDRIDIDAGAFTRPVVLYARWFYRMRQRRWRALAGRLTNGGPGLP